MIVVSFLIFGSPFLVKKTRSCLIGGNYLAFFVFLLMMFIVVTSGGTNSLLLTILVNFAFISYLLTGFKNGIVWFVITMLMLATLKILETKGIVSPAADQGTFSNFISSIITGYILGGIFEFVSKSNFKKFMQERDHSEQVAGEQRELLNETIEVMAAVSGGDLSKQISFNIKGELGELKNSVNDALQMLSQTITRVANTGSTIHSGSLELSISSQSVSTGSTSQAASLEEISASMNEIGEGAKTNNENAQQARVLSNQTAKEVAKSNQQMEEMLDSMKEINQTSSNVSKVIKVIDEIAFQTNLLALNAAVEAARAGKYGKGFAVVAEEVRNLASRSADAARNTTELIEKSISDVNRGVEKADQTAETLKSFIASIEKVNDLVGEISASSQEQSTGVTEINNGLSQVNDIVLANTSISEETASASQELTAQSQYLQQLMGQFKVRTESIIQYPSD